MISKMNWNLQVSKAAQWKVKNDVVTTASDWTMDLQWFMGDGDDTFEIPGQKSQRPLDILQSFRNASYAVRRQPRQFCCIT